MNSTRLPGVARILIASNTVSSLGTGLVLPLTLIYLHEVRGIALPVVGLLLTMSAAVGLAAVPFSGALTDRFGARLVLSVVMAGQALAQAGLAWAHSVPTAIPSLLVLGASLGPAFPTFGTMLAGAIPQPRLQQRAFAVSFTGLNAGIGIGAVIGAAVADVHHPGSFQVLFLANCLSCVLFTAMIARLPNIAARREPDEAKAGYRDVLAHRGLRMVVIATLVLGFTGYAALDSGLPAYATVEAHVSPRVVALSMTVNTTVIVVAQLIVLRAVQRLRRSRALMAIGLIWGVSWAVLGLSALPAAESARIACVLAFAGLFGLGETVLAPTVAPLVNSLADDRIRGRANALSNSAVSIAFVVSPAISTGMIAAGVSALWLGLLCAGCLGTVVLGARLSRLLTTAQDRPTAARDRADATDPEPVGPGLPAS